VTAAPSPAPPERDTDSGQSGAREPAGPELVPIAEAAERLGVPLGRLEQWLRDGQIVGQRDADGLRVPVQLLVGGAPIKGLPGVITVLRDARFTDEEIIDWLYRADESLPGTPAEALLSNRSKEIKRRAQVAGY
jgi:Rv2175c C-terminal domain of unknown function